MTIRHNSAVAILAVLCGCLGSHAVTCDDGVVCPSGLHCAMAGPTQLCVPVTCGNGRLDPGEVCDDGNNVSGDGCPADCRPACGDGIVDPGEACDDGNNASGDGCSADCRSNERCGNGILDPEEACDDGNLTSHDGCSTRCQFEQLAWSTTAASPGGAPGAMVYDAARNVSVLVMRTGTWEWDGAAWSQRSQASPPPALFTYQIVYDVGNKRVIVFGVDAVWRWDGTTWSQQAVTSSPPGLPTATVAYDARRHKTVLFGGEIGIGNGMFDNGTWDWDGTRWQQVMTATQPPVRSEALMAYDARRGVMVMLGGRSNALIPDDVWEFDGTNWTQHADLIAPGVGSALAFDTARGSVVMLGRGLSPGLWGWGGAHWTPIAMSSASSPLLQNTPALAYDIARDRLVLYGGTQLPFFNSLPVLNDTWENDGTAWSNRTVRSLGRQSGGMAFDSAAQKVIVIGGDQLADPVGSANAGLLGDTWAWDGITWVKQLSGPSPRVAFGMTQSGVVVLFGGLGPDGVTLGDTWLYGSGSWSQYSNPFSPAAPPARSQHAMAYDPVHGNVILFAGAPPNTHALSDTWSWTSQGGWTHLSPAHIPTQRQNHAMTFDSFRQVITLFGGRNSNTLLADTWTWNGTDWTQATPATAPSARRNHALAFDSGRGKLIMFGGINASGILADTWAWDGTTWTQLHPATTPPARSAHMMAFDPIRARVVMFGGADSTHPLDDVWEWDGRDWARITYASSPPAGSRQAMAYDPDRTTTLMFGGLGVDGVHRSNQTWIWGGSDWHAVTPAASPPARAEHALAFDSARGRAVLFGGADADPRAPDGVNRFNDTWEWDGASWQVLHPAVSPPARRGHGMVYDAARATTLVFGGDQAGALLADQWAWDGTRWTASTPGTVPPRRTDFAMVYDAGRERVVLFGGLGDSGRLGDVWEWDGTAWADRTPRTVFAPLARSGTGMVYDATRRRVVLSGGQSDTAILDDTWEWDGTAWTQLTLTTFPSARHHQAIAFDAARHTAIAFGGDDGSPTGLVDTWLFRHDDPGAPVEACLIGADNEGDGKAGCDDDDCTGFCTRCGDGVCDATETHGLCPADCTPR